MNFIVAVDEAWNIGCNGQLLTHVPEDMANFRKTTTGGVVVMGRKTLESFPEGKPLKNRRNIVLTRNKDYQPDDVILCHSIEQLMEELKHYQEEQVWIIGGSEIYNLLIPYCDKGYITILRGEYNADSKIMNLDQDPSWKMVEEGPWQTSKKGPEYKFTVYENKDK